MNIVTEISLWDMTPCNVAYFLQLQGARKKDRNLTRETIYSFRMLVSTHHTI
jgi:hypothetical protein